MPSPKKTDTFATRVRAVKRAHEHYVSRKNPLDRSWNNGVFERFTYPVITAEHVPLQWRYDFNPKTNPFFMERLGINAALNPGAFLWKGRVCLVVRTEGYDRKSFFAIAESKNGIDNFRFRAEPLDIPELSPETNIYDMRITPHEDGWVYGIFCSESRDPKAPAHDLSSAVAQAGMVRTRDLITWERLPNLRTPASQRVKSAQFNMGCSEICADEGGALKIVEFCFRRQKTKFTRKYNTRRIFVLYGKRT